MEGWYYSTEECVFVCMCVWMFKDVIGYALRDRRMRWCVGGCVRGICVCRGVKRCVLGGRECWTCV